MLLAILTYLSPLQDGWPATAPEVRKAPPECAVTRNITTAASFSISRNLTIDAAAWASLPVEYTEFEPHLLVRTAEPGRSFPLVLSPYPGATGMKSAAALVSWLNSHQEWVRDKYYKHGALLFRGFDIDTAAQFEDVARGLVEPSGSRCVRCFVYVC
jgi:hypothetical protein